MKSWSQIALPMVTLTKGTKAIMRITSIIMARQWKPVGSRIPSAG